MPAVNKVARAATDARAEREGLETFGNYRAIRDRYKAEYEAGLKNLAVGYPAICQAMVNTAIAGNPLAAKWCADQLNFGERHEADTPSGNTNILQLVIGSTNNQPPASIPAEWRVLPPPEPSISHKGHSAKYDEGDNASS